MAELNSRGGRVKSETQTDIEGITRIKYEIPTLDRTGQVNLMVDLRKFQV